MEQLKAKIEAMTAGEVWEIAFSLKDKLDDASDLIMTAALEVLETKVSDEKFLELAAKL